MKKTINIEVEDCMSFNDIYNLALDCIKQYGYKNLNEESQSAFDQFFNKIFAESYSIPSKTKIKAIINYPTFKEKMLIADKYAFKKGFRKGTDEYKECFIQCLHNHIMDAYETSLTPSGEIKGKNKPSMITVPNPTRKQKSAISKDIFELFPDVMNSARENAKNKEDAELKINHLKSGVTSLVKSVGENMFNIKDLEYPEKATNEELVKVEKERYKQLIVLTMVMIGIENVLSVSKDQLDKLMERFMPVNNDGKYDWMQLHSTKSRQNFVQNIYKVLTNKDKMNGGTPKMLSQ